MKKLYDWVGQMTEYGVQISQEGVPIGRGGDFQKVIDHRWPYLDIALEKRDAFVRTGFGPTQGYWLVEIAEHNLGYIPAVRFRELSFSSNPSGGPPDYDIIRPKVVATKNKVYLRGLWTSGFATYTTMELSYSLTVFACDITTNVQYPIETPAPAPRSSAGKYGIKVLDYDQVGIDMRSTEMSHYALNSNAKALAIQQTGLYQTNAAEGYAVIVNHGLVYPPTYLIARYEDPSDWVSAYPNPLPGDDYIYPLNDDLIGVSSNSGTTLTIAGAQAAIIGKFAYVILKDPLGNAG